MRPGFLFLAVILLVIGCRGKSKNQNLETTEQNVDSNLSINELDDFDTTDVRNWSLWDSNYTHFNHLLDTSLKIANRHKYEKTFNLTLKPGGLKYGMYATISFGHLFANDRKHLLIKRGVGEKEWISELYSDIFLLDNNSFKKMASDTSYELVEESFEDLNQDGYKDYVVQSYSTSGCCPRNLEKGYIYNPGNGHFTSLDFFNREMDSLSNDFFETSYGLGNHISLFKYKWKGLKKILVEEIYVQHIGETPKDLNPNYYTRLVYPGGRKQKIKRLPKEFARLKMAGYISPIEE
jgi:hypothetical protein